MPRTKRSTCQIGWYGIEEGVLKLRKRCYTTLREKKKSLAKHGYKYNVFWHLPPPNPPLGTQKSMHYNDQNQNELFPSTPHLTIHNPRQHQLSITVVEFHVPRSYLSVRMQVGIIKECDDLLAVSANVKSEQQSSVADVKMASN